MIPFIQFIVSPAINDEPSGQTPSPAVTKTPTSTISSVRKPVVEKKPLEKFGTQNEKAKIFFAFRNGDKHHAGVKVTVHPTKFKTFDQVSPLKIFIIYSLFKLKEFLTKEVQLPTGPVMKVVTPDGKLVKDLDSIEDGAKYICAGAEKLNKEMSMYDINLL